MIFIRYYNDIIVDDSVDLDFDEVKKLFADGISVFNLYVIAVSDIGNGIMEILSSQDVLKQVFKSKNYVIIAIAKGKRNIERILCDIIKQWVEDGRDLNSIKSHYLRSAK